MSPARARRLLLGVCGAGALASWGCTPDEVQAPVVQAPQPEQIEAAVVPITGLIGEWKLDETSGTTAADTKNGFNATVLGGAAFVAGKIGNALNLNNGTAGTGGKYAQMPSNATLDNVQEGNYTISAWFFPYTVPTDSTVNNRAWAIVVKASPHMGLMFNTAGKFLARHYVTGPVGHEAKGTTIFPAGVWYHVAGTVNKTTGAVKVYVDGVFHDQASFTPNTAAEEYGTTPFQIGKSGTVWAANGKVDQVRIYNRELSATEVADLFNETAGSGPTVTTNAASNITTTTARLNGSADPNGAATTGWFRYSATNPGTCNDTFGTRSPSSGGTALGSGTAAVAYNRDLAGLDGGKTYYFCAIASNSSGTSFGTVRSFMAGGMALRMGMSGMTNKIGQGPGSNTAAPIYRFVQFATTPSSIANEIAIADAQDIVLMFPPSRSRGNWTVGDPDKCQGSGQPGDFVWECYERKVREFDSIPVLADAIARRRVLLYVVDEPNIGSFNGTFTPELTNQAAMLHKEIWPNALTFVRVSPSLLQSGWNGPNGQNLPPPAGGWTGVDYAWVAYSGQHYRDSVTFAQQLTEQKAIADQLNVNVGIAASLNIWAGGIKANFDGVTACWDHDLNASTPTGIVAGESLNHPTGVEEGDFYPCGTLPSGFGNVVANPAWIRHYADAVDQVEYLPFASHWTYPQQSGLAWAGVYIDRSDFVAALDYSINQGATRSSWDGYRAPKPFLP